MTRWSQSTGTSRHYQIGGFATKNQVAQVTAAIQTLPMEDPTSVSHFHFSSVGQPQWSVMILDCSIDVFTWQRHLIKTGKRSRVCDTWNAPQSFSLWSGSIRVPWTTITSLSTTTTTWWTIQEGGHTSDPGCTHHQCQFSSRNVSSFPWRTSWAHPSSCTTGRSCLTTHYCCFSL